MGDKGGVAPAVLTAIVAVWLEAIASVGCETVAVVVGHGSPASYSYAGRGGYTSLRGPNWPSVGSAQQNHGSVSRGLPSVEPARIGSAWPAGDGDRPAAWSAAARTFANVSGIGSEPAALLYERREAGLEAVAVGVIGVHL